MKKLLLLILGASIIMFLSIPVFAAGQPEPFGLILDKMSYEDVLNQLNQKSWQFNEYEKKDFKPVKKNSSQLGKSTFLQIKPKKMKGLKSLYLFFNQNRILEAVIMVLDHEMLASVKEVLNQKYKLVKDSLLREDPGTSFPYMLWEQGSAFIELQKLSVHIIRLVYVNKTVYENYREFFYKSYGTFRPAQEPAPWLKDL